MRGELIRHKPDHSCRPPGALSRLVNGVGLYDHWICPDCAAVWVWNYADAYALRKMWRGQPNRLAHKDGTSV